MGEIAHILETERKKDRPQKTVKPHYISFVREGEKKAPNKSKGTCILDEARIWEMKVDLKHQLQFPEEIAQTTL